MRLRVALCEYFMTTFNDFGLHADINRALSAITSRQIAVFADSCYAGTLAQGDALLTHRLAHLGCDKG